VSGIIQAALIANGDPYAPVVSRPEAQQWNPYQDNDLFCIDIEYSAGFAPERFKKFLAVEVATPYEPILCDFEAIAIAYP
jgi:hypothetical protein